MKIEISKDKASRLLNCGMLVMVTAAAKDKATITPCAWRLPLSRKPPALGVALAKSHYSSELIRQGEEFIVNIPVWGLLDKVKSCGSVSGRKVDKFSAFGLSRQKPCILSKTPAIAECIAHIECSLFDVKEVGDHFLFLGEVVYAQAEEKNFVHDLWSIAGVEFIFHVGGELFFKSSVPGAAVS
ncbi:MAG: flavin reductase family protein [Candidatus Omnitrophota bacterium]|nr:flavin reductase family protein [Candidatus Omnitrophota bacterium]